MAGGLDVEKTVIYPIEKAVSAISDVRFVGSKSRQELSIRVKDVGTVVDSHETQTSIVRIDGERVFWATVVGLLPMALALGVGPRRTSR